MPRFDDFIVYSDESGDHTLGAVDPSYPIFVLAFCMIEKQDYARDLIPAVTEFKFRFFGHDQVILHELDIRKNRGPFAIIRDPRVRESFMKDLNTLVESSRFMLLASAIRKDRYLARYRDPVNPYHLALGFGLERLYSELLGRGCRGGRTFILFEKRGEKEDNELELEFRRIRDGGNWHGAELPFEAFFCDKSATRQDFRWRTFWRVRSADAFSCRSNRTVPMTFWRKSSGARLMEAFLAGA